MNPDVDHRVNCDEEGLANPNAGLKNNEEGLSNRNAGRKYNEEGLSNRNAGLRNNVIPRTDATDSHYEYVPMGDIEDQYDDACVKPISPATDDTHYEIPVNSGDARNRGDETSNEAQSTGNVVNLVNESQYEDLVRDPYSNIDVESPYEPLK
jgi:hypothetical protein